MPNVRHIAKRAGVSISTVSRVLNNAPGVSAAARKAVMAAVNGVGYVPAVGRRSTSNIALLYTGTPTLDSPFDAALLAGVYEAVALLGRDLLVLDAHRSRKPGESFSHMFLRKGVQGALVRTTTSSEGLCREVLDEGFPAVALGYRVAGAEARCIYSDSRDASSKAIEHLIALGHRRIAVCMHVVDDSDHADRRAAYQEVLAARQIPYDERLVVRVPAHRDGGVQAVRRIMAMADRPTALFLTDPLTSLGAVAEARRLGLQVPADLSIVGFDDAELRLGMVPQLTAVCQDSKALGREAVAFLVSVTNRRERALGKPLRCWFEVHETTAARPISAVPAASTSRRSAHRKSEVRST